MTLHGVDRGRDDFVESVIEPEDTVVIVDYCLSPIQRMVDIVNSHKMVWIDHHKSSIEEYPKKEKQIPGLRSVDRSACELTWLYFGDSRTMPVPVSLLGRYDVWDLYRDENVLPFQFGLRMYDTELDRSLDFWNELLFEDKWKALITEIIEKGRTALEYEMSSGCFVIEKCSFSAHLGNLSCLAVNTARANSLLFEEYFKTYGLGEYDCALAFYQTGTVWKFSLYAPKKKASSKILEEAVSRGGGGHPSACGFQSATIPDDFIVDSKPKA